MSIKNITHSVSARRRIGTTVYHVLMILVSFLMLYPVLWLVASSFKPNGDIFSTATSLIPKNFTTRTLHHRLERLRRLHVRQLLCQLSVRGDPLLRRHGHFVGHRGVRAGAHPVQGAQLLVRAHDRHHDAARPGHDDPAFRALQQHGLGRHLSAHDRAQLLCQAGSTSSSSCSSSAASRAIWTKPPRSTAAAGTAFSCASSCP